MLTNISLIHCTLSNISCPTDRNKTLKKMKSSSVITFGLVIVLWLGVSSSVAEEKVVDDIFSSISKMEALVHQENAIVDMLDSFLVDAKMRLNIIQKYNSLISYFSFLSVQSPSESQSERLWCERSSSFLTTVRQ